jgi:hypothetical protein
VAMTSSTKAIAKMSKPLIKSLQSRQGALPGAVSHFVSKVAAPVQAGCSQVMVI